MNSGIYLLEFPDGARYVGSSYQLESRKKEHQTRMKSGRHPNRRLQAAWDRHRAFEFTVLELAAVDRLIAAEQAWMDKLNPPLNICLVAGKRANLGRKMSAETNQKNRERMLGNTHSTGRVLTPEHRARIAASMVGKNQGKRSCLGRRLGPETRAKISESLRARSGVTASRWKGQGDGTV
jgi:group I intron endonuclease